MCIGRHAAFVALTTIGSHYVWRMLKALRLCSWLTFTPRASRSLPSAKSFVSSTRPSSLLPTGALLDRASRGPEDARRGALGAAGADQLRA